MRALQTCVHVRVHVQACNYASVYVHVHAHVCVFPLQQGTPAGEQGVEMHLQEGGDPGPGAGPVNPQLTLFSSKTLKTNVANLVGSPNGKNCL